jgi:hypothetical protein
LDTDTGPKRFAALFVSARKPTKRGDAVISTLPFAVDKINRRGEPRGPAQLQRMFEGTSAFVKAPVDATHGHEEAIDALRATVAPHTSALGRLREDVRIGVVVFDDDFVRRRRIRLSPETLDWLAKINAYVVFHLTCSAPSGTEAGSVCGFCGILRPLTDEEAFIGTLRVTTPYLGTADARLIVRSPDERVGKTIAENNRWWLFQPRDDLTVLVKSARQTDGYRGGAVAASTLLREVRANRRVRRALLTGSTGSVDLDITHRTNSAVARAFFRRHDVRRMADIRASLFYELVPELTPQFSKDGDCVRCTYVQPWPFR